MLGAERTKPVRKNLWATCRPKYVVIHWGKRSLIGYKEHEDDSRAKIRCSGCGAKRATCITTICKACGPKRWNSLGAKRTTSATKNIWTICGRRCSVTDLTQKLPHPLQRKSLRFATKNKLQRVWCKGSDIR